MKKEYTALQAMNLAEYRHCKVAAFVFWQLVKSEGPDTPVSRAEIEALGVTIDAFSPKRQALRVI